LRHKVNEVKVAIQGLGEVPATIELVLEKEKPEITYILTSDFQLKYIASHAGYKKANEDLIKEVGKRTGTKVVFKECDCFDPKSVAKAITEVLQEIDVEKDEMIINYTGGTAVVRLLLGATGFMLSGFADVRLVYAIRYPKGPTITSDQTDVIKEVFPSDLNLILNFIKKRHPEAVEPEIFRLKKRPAKKKK
jgi:hypothetical protein